MLQIPPSPQVKGLMSTLVKYTFVLPLGPVAGSVHVRASVKSVY